MRFSSSEHMAEKDTLSPEALRVVYKVETVMPICEKTRLWMWQLLYSEAVLP